MGARVWGKHGERYGAYLEKGRRKRGDSKPGYEAPEEPAKLDDPDVPCCGARRHPGPQTGSERFSRCNEDF